uniref:Uncharacterized protein TCIL3000_11_13770 n=1 Tax=Trypanosoma congolense (strain IL3000) TaxID=1068625 RepID=G0V2J9_TRYCI|nr:unnamed protein product [Trypanosoma congolense IL3000]
MADSRKLLYSPEELVALVRSLDRPQENGLFSQDVLLQYPELAESYTKVCPKRCDIATATKRAANNAYGYDVHLTGLKEDVQLMVSNCIRFNGPEGPYADAARSFEKFAVEKIDAFISRKSGGRRLSSLRLAAPERQTSGKRVREGETREIEAASAESSLPRRHHLRSFKDTTGDIKANIRAESAEDGTDRETELVRLIDSLNRREDKGAFVVDVAEAYPELKTAYELACPVKMNLNIMKERARSGYYFEQQHRRRRNGVDLALYIRGSVAESLPLLRNDVELMVNNCINFNAGAPEWIRLAGSFHRFAHRKIDDFILRLAPHLRGTKTGAEVYVQNSIKPQQGEFQVKPDGDGGGKLARQEDNQLLGSDTAPSAFPPSSPQAVAVPSLLPRSGVAIEEPKASPPPVSISVVSTIVPMIEPTALQPMFATPNALRERIVSDHLHKGTLHARLISSTADNKKDKADTEGGNRTKRDTEFLQLYAPAYSCRAVLEAFLVSVHEFYRVQRESQNFVSPFTYMQDEERLYCDYVTLVTQQLERVLLVAVLYEQEKAELYDWVAEKAICQAGGGCTALPTEALHGQAPCSWLDQVHLCYLVRFLCHIPQLLGLACSEADSLSKDEYGRPHLYLTTVAQGVVGKIAKITEELLSFISNYEQKLSDIPKNSEVADETQPADIK